MLQREKTAEELIEIQEVKSFIDKFEITPDTAEALVAAYDSFDSSFRILVGVKESTMLQRGTKFLIVETHAVPAIECSSAPGNSGNWRDQFTLAGEPYDSTDPTFAGFVTVAKDAWKSAFAELTSGQMKEIPTDGLSFFDRKIL